MVLLRWMVIADWAHKNGLRTSTICTPGFGWQLDLSLAILSSRFLCAIPWLSTAIWQLPEGWDKSADEKSYGQVKPCRIHIGNIQVGLSSDHFSILRTTLNLFELFKIYHEYNSLRYIYTRQISLPRSPPWPNPFRPPFWSPYRWIYHARVTAVLCNDIYWLPSCVACNHLPFTYPGIARCDYCDHGMMVSYYLISRSPHGGPNGNGIIDASSLEVWSSCGLASIPKLLAHYVISSPISRCMQKQAYISSTSRWWPCNR